MQIKAKRQKAIFTVVLLAVAAVLYFFKIPCVIFTLVGVPCLGCGMTRAIISALLLDFVGAFSYHMMFWSVPILYICFLFDGRVFKKKWLNILFYCIILVGFIINWLCGIML